MVLAEQAATATQSVKSVEKALREKEIGTLLPLKKETDLTKWEE